MSVNYTDEMIARLKEVYDGQDSEDARSAQVQQLATELDKAPASIRAKLVREGLYVAKDKAPKGKAGLSKADLVSKIAHQLNVDEDIVGSLEKATKVSLTMVLKNLM